MADQYDASDLSDGERVMFYLLGQCLLVRPGCILIIDEPELHIHKAILSAFWDAIETARNDCAFIYLTHDLEFASSRRSAQKIALQRYHKKPQERWELEVIPEDAENSGRCHREGPGQPHANPLCRRRFGQLRCRALSSRLFQLYRNPGWFLRRGNSFRL